MHVEAALRAVERAVPSYALEVGLHVQEFESDHLRVDGDRMRAIEVGVEGLFDASGGWAQTLGGEPR